MSLPGSNDAHVQGTNDDAQLSKMSCVKLGYFNDDSLRHFVKHPVRRAPLINRGYYSRYAALRGLLLRFLELQPPSWDAGQQAQQQQQQQQQQQAGDPNPQGMEVWPPPPPPRPPPQQQQAEQQQQPSDGPPRQNGLQQGGPKQVVSLGAGFDTTYFQLVKEGRAPERYIELDFREVTSRKAAIIQQTPDLLSCLGPPEACTIDVEGGRVLAPHYSLLPVDLRDLQSLEAALCGSSSQECGSIAASGAAEEGAPAPAAAMAAAGAEAGAAAGAAEPPLQPPEATGDCGCGGSAVAGADGTAACAAADGPAAVPAAAQPVLDPQLPTFVLSECVLVYMEPRESAEVVRWLGQRLHCAAMAIYEQIRPHDAFGRQMLLNLECRGCPLKGIHGTPDLEAQRRRFLEGGWHRAEARSMNEVYRSCLEPGDKRRIERLELFDEFEEWDLIQAHYCIALGVKDSSGLLDGFGFQEYRPQLPAALLAQRRPIG